jgi:hypothetical protein
MIMLSRVMKSHTLVIEDRQAILEVCLNPTKLTMKRTMLLGFFLTCQLAVAQKITDEEKEKLIPYHYQTKAILTAIPGYLEMGGGNLNYGYGLNLDGFVGKYASFTAGMTTAGYGDSKYTNGNDPFMSDSYQGMKRSGSTYANFNLHILDKIGMGRIRVEKFRGQTISGNEQTTYYDVYKKRGPVRKIIALRGGFYSWNTTITPETSDKWLMVKTGTTTQLPVTDRMFTNLKTSDLSFGISFGKFVERTNMGGGGVISYFRNFYVDVLVNSSVSMDNYVDKLKATYVPQIGQGTLTKSSMGWRAGWKMIGLGRKYWVGGYYFEFGQRPGLQDRSAYLQMGLILGTKYPFIPMQ